MWKDLNETLTIAQGRDGKYSIGVMIGVLVNTIHGDRKEQKDSSGRQE